MQNARHGGRERLIMIYLDNCATTRTDREVAEYAMDVMLNHFGNPSSLHFAGSDAYGLLQDARSKVSRMISAQNNCIYFTSGGTEGNNLAIQGAAFANWERGRHIITTDIEHSSVLDCCKYLETQGFEVTYVKPDPHTHTMRAEDILNAVRPDTILISMMLVNNETGEILPLKEVVEKVRENRPDILIHTDLVQAFGKVPFKLYECGVDLATASSHKIHGTKGIGMLYIRTGCKVRPFKYGGSQEGKINPGTENVPLACAFGLATDKLIGTIRENYQKVEELKAYLLKRVQAAFPNVHINSGEGYSPYVVNFSLPGYSSGDIVDYCSFRDIYISAGSACSRGVKSHALQMYGFSDELVSSALRIGLDVENTREELDTLIDTLLSFVHDR